MDLKLLPTSSVMPLSNLGRAGAALTSPSAVKSDPQGFSSVLSNTLKSVSAAQEEASRMQREVQLENPKVSLEETMMAMQKAQIGFQATLNVRNRLVQAYTDIMNMSV